MSEHEHEFEPVPGLPERLPPGERMLWQGAPSWRVLAVRAQHVRKVAIYFGALAAWHVYDVAAAGTGALAAVRGAAWLLVLGASTVALLTLLAWALARSTMYTITTKRLVLRFGVALPMSVNLPFAVVQTAGIVRHKDGTCDLPLTLTARQRVGYLLTWPHVRPWRLFPVQPTLRALPDGERVASLLAAALQATQPELQAGTQPAIAARPVREAVPALTPQTTVAA